MHGDRHQHRAPQRGRRRSAAQEDRPRASSAVRRSNADRRGAAGRRAHSAISQLMQRLSIVHESWPIDGSFTISRGSKTTAEVVVVTLERNGKAGRGECVPYPHYGETVESVISALEERRRTIEAGVERSEIPALLGLKAARNALDCALWDLECKLANERIWQLLDRQEPRKLVTAFTISLASAEEMAAAASRAAERPLLKVKLGGGHDAERLRAVRQAAPRARLIVDANEGWNAAELPLL